MALGLGDVVAVDEQDAEVQVTLGEVAAELGPLREVAREPFRDFRARRKLTIASGTLRS